MKCLQRILCHSYQRGRSPCGERGLKYPHARRDALPIASLPVRGAWVEMPDVPLMRML